MSRFPGMKKLIKAGGRAALEQRNADELVGKSQKFQETAEAAANAAPPVQPFDPPPPPTITDVIAKRRALSIEWDLAAPALYVETVLLLVTRLSDGQTRLERVRELDGGAWVVDLLAEPHTVETAQEDRWGRISTFSPAAQFSPLPSVADQIGEDLEVAAGQIVPYLPSDPTVPSPFNTPELFTEGLFNLTHQAAAQRANVLPFGRSLYSNYKTGTNANVRGTTFTPFYQSPDTTFSFVDENVEGDRLLQQTAGATLPSHLTPFQYAPLPADQQYVFAARVRNNGTNTRGASLTIQLSPDGSTAGSEVSGPTVDIPGGKERTLFITFTRGTNTHMRFRYSAHAGGSLRWTKNQLVPADGRDLATITEAPLFSMPVLGADGINARLISTMDLAAVRGVFQELTIESAKMLDVSVEKLTAGFLDVQLDMIAGGSVVWDGGILYDNGVELTDVAESTNLTPNVGRASKITSPATGGGPTPWGALNFFSNDSGTPTRGISIWADGENATSRVGLIKIIATNGNQNPDSPRTAALILRASEAGRSRADLEGDFYVRDDVDVAGQFRNPGAQQAQFGGAVRITGDVDARGVLEYSPSGEGPRIKSTVERTYLGVASGQIIAVSAPRLTSRGVWMGYMKNPSTGRWDHVPGAIKDVSDNGEPRIENSTSSVRDILIRGISP